MVKRKKDDLCPVHDKEVYPTRIKALLAVQHISDKVEWCLATEGWHIVENPERRSEG